MPRSELTPIFERVQSMIDYVRENLDDGEYDLFLDLLVPEPVGAKKPGRKKRAGKKATSSSSRKRGLPSGVTGGNGTELIDTPCVHRDSSGAVCGHGASYPVHNSAMGYSGYHEFQSAEQVAAAGGV